MDEAFGLAFSTRVPGHKLSALLVSRSDMLLSLSYLIELFMFK